jgi:hypothetical protein
MDASRIATVLNNFTTSDRIYGLLAIVAPSSKRYFAIVDPTILPKTIVSDEKK